MASDFTVSKYGTDTDGRPIYMTAYMHQWWEGICRELGFTPTIVQGAWMAKVPGGGAADSAGYHDGGGCLDLRVWDLSSTQVEAVTHAVRWGGAGGWVRDQAHGGMDPHFHLVLGSDDGLSQGAAWQWLNYLNGGDGLSSGGRDYHPRPRPIVQVPPDSLMGDDMAEYGPQILDAIKELKARTNEIAANQLARGRAQGEREKADRDELRDILADIKAADSNDARAKQVDRALKKLDQIEANTAPEETV